MNADSEDRVDCVNPGCSNRPLSSTAVRTNGLCMPCFDKTGKIDPGVRTPDAAVPQSILSKPKPGCSLAITEQALTFVSRIRKQNDGIVTAYDLRCAADMALKYYQGFEDCPSGCTKFQFAEIWATLWYWYEQAEPSSVTNNDDN